ncbi:MAG TPA: SH3 domain-containing protein [Planctomycetes bacterium]|nr:SH3 domain-containing protein [Planctomycetota bacterium]
MNLRLVTSFFFFALLAPVAALQARSAGFSAPAIQANQAKGGTGEKPHFPRVKGAGALPKKALDHSLEESSRKRGEGGPAGSSGLGGEQVLYELTESQEARLFASDKAPAIGVRLAKGQLVWSLPGSEEGAYRQVLVPGGFPGWIYARYVQIGEDGTGKTVGRRVSFRYRPETKSYPLTLLPRGTRVLALSREGDWWKVLVPSASLAWVRKSALKERQRTPLDPSKIKLPEDLVRRLAAQKKKAQAPFLAQQAQWKLAQKKEKARKQLEKDLLAVQQAFEENKATADLEELSRTDAALGVLKKKAESLGFGDGPLSQRLRILEEEVSRRRLLLETKVAIQEASGPKIKKAAPTPAAPKIHPRRRFVETGWIEKRPGIYDYSAYRLIKGGRTLYYVTVPGGRYDLEDYVGREVGILGVKVRPQGADFRVIQVDHLVILSGR